MEFLNDYINVTIMAICLVVGFVWKNYTKENNNAIPSLVSALGLVLAMLNCYLTKTPVTLEIVAMGLISGLSSTGLHQLLKTWLARNEG